MKKYWHIYFLILVWCLYDALTLKFGKHHVFIAGWHIGMLIFIFVSIKEKLVVKNLAIKVSLISFLIVISVKILLNLIAAFGADYQEYNSFVNNAYMDFILMIFICVVHLAIGFKWSK